MSDFLEYCVVSILGQILKLFLIVNNLFVCSNFRQAVSIIFKKLKLGINKGTRASI